MIVFTAKFSERISRLFGGTVERLASGRVMARLGALAQFRIKERTGKGIDVHGRPFAPYSDEWGEARREKGRQTSRPDLNFSGRMWGGLDQSAAEGTVELFFTGFDATKAHGHNYGVRQNAFFGPTPQREFFGLNDKDEEALTREVRRALANG